MDGGGEDAEATASSIRILYVDDDPDYADLATTFLERDTDEFDVTAVNSATAALDRLEPRTDCIVSDYDMPGMDGLDFLEAARERRPELPFILVTGKGSEEIASEAISRGVTDYLQKGSGRGQYAILSNRIRNAVSASRAERAAAYHRRVSDLVRDTVRAVVRASTRAEVEAAVCDRIADSNPYVFAWIGAVDDDGDRVRPRTSAGVESGYLDRITVTADGGDPNGRGPMGLALRSDDVAVAQNVRTDPSFRPWREAALERGFESVAAIPLRSRTETYGVLGVYAASPNAFDATERQLLRELGETVGHAIRAIENRDRLAQQYRTLFEEAPVMYALTRNEDGTPVVEDCNGRFLDRLGYDREAVVGEPLASFYTPASARTLLEEGGYRRALDGEFTTETRDLVAAGGEVVDTLLRAVPRYDDDGRVVGTITVYVDRAECR